MVSRFEWVGAFALTVAGCRGCQAHAGSDNADRDLEVDEDEDRDEAKESIWRARLAIVGAGRVSTADRVFDCVSDGSTQSGECGPRLVRFGELAPPLLVAGAAPGWRFDRWQSMIHEPDGSTRVHSTADADGPRYMNAFGYADTGELEDVTIVFAIAAATGAIPSR